jgi:hypothetical protein
VSESLVGEAVEARKGSQGSRMNPNGGVCRVPRWVLETPISVNCACRLIQVCAPTPKAESSSLVRLPPDAFVKTEDCTRLSFITTRRAFRRDGLCS